MSDRHILFFDIDGVLIEPHGYRRATIETIQDFLNTLGISNVAIDETEIAAFEAQGITSEWDIIPLFILAWLESNVNLHNSKKPVESWSSFSELIEIGENHPVNTLNITTQFKQFLVPYLNPSESFFYSHLNNPIFKTIFPRLAKHPWVWKELLEGNRNIQKAPLSRNLQSLVVGSKEFTAITNQVCNREVISYLLSYDKPQLTSESVEKLQKLLKNEKIHSAAITARLSAKFLKNHNSVQPHYYFPEAEMGLQAAGMPNLPVIGYGEIQYLSLLLNQSPLRLAKPGYIHAFLVLTQALGIDLDEIFAFLSDELRLNQRYIDLQHLKNGILKKLWNGHSIHLHIFEDSYSGIQSVRGLQAMFFANGIHAYVHPYGIASDRRKIEALLKENASIYPTINEALSICFQNLI